MEITLGTGIVCLSCCFNQKYDECQLFLKIYLYTSFVGTTFNNSGYIGIYFLIIFLK